jgi:predicted nucleic acid-binding protein
VRDSNLRPPDPVPISLDIHYGAVAIAERYGYGIYDSLIASAALEAGCKTLYSEDLQDGKQSIGN